MTSVYVKLKNEVLVETTKVQLGCATAFAASAVQKTGTDEYLVLWAEFFNKEADADYAVADYLNNHPNAQGKSNRNYTNG